MQERRPTERAVGKSLTLYDHQEEKNFSSQLEVEGRGLEDWGGFGLGTLVSGKSVVKYAC